MRAFVREPFEVERFGDANDDLTATSLRAGRLMAFMFPVVMLILNVSSVGALWIGGDRIGSGQMQIGALIAFLSYLVQILMSVMMATFVAVLVPRASVCADRIQEVLETPTRRSASPDEPVTQLSRRNTLEFDHVGFRYPGAEAPVLTDVSLVARARPDDGHHREHRLGKTTLLNLIPRLFDVTDGAVRIDGVDVRDLDLETLWSRVGLIPQRPYLFSGTIESNLRHANPDATDDELWEALRIAQAADFVGPRRRGLAVDRSRRAAPTSRAVSVSVSRSLAPSSAGPASTSSTTRSRPSTSPPMPDCATALAPVTVDATVLIVAQRVATIMNADQILVLEDGHVVGLGTHRELLERCPTYAEIVASQMSAEEAA